MSGATAAGRDVGPRVVLIGPPGAGKTSVGTALAKRWGVGFRDSDADVEELLGMPISDVFVQLGERRSGSTNESRSRPHWPSTTASWPSVGVR